MKLLKLEILNLASLDKQDGEVVNFEEGALGQSTIFSIVGPTGSGKSTLLDAICLALYNRAPRYPRKKGEKKELEIFGAVETSEKNRLAPTDCRNILTRGKKNGYSKLTFLANNGCVYRAEWHVNIKRVLYDNATTLLYKLTPSNGGLNEEKAEWKELPTIIGLDYEQFLRTVLIAQGAFANFLNAKDDERCELLEKLIGCQETYSDIIREIAARKSEAEKAYSAVNAEVEVVKENMLGEEELTRLMDEIAQLEKAEKELDELLKKTETALKWHDDEEQLQKNLEQRQNELKRANQELESISADASRLQLHDAVLPALDLLRDVRRLEDDIDKLQKAIAESNLETEKQKLLIDEGGKRLGALRAAAEKAQKRMDQRAPHIRKARELNTQIKAANHQLDERNKNKAGAENELKKAEKALQQNSKDIRHADETNKKALAQLKALQEETDSRKKELAGKVEEAEKELVPAKQKVAHLSADELQNAKSMADKAVSNIRQAIDAAEKKENAQTEKQAKQHKATQLNQQNCALDQMMAQLTIESLTAETGTLHNTYTLMTSENWKQHRSRLQDNKPCPLCGSTHHPYKTDDKQLDETVADLHLLIEKKEKELKEQTKKKEDWLGKKKSNEGELKSIGERLKQLDEDMANYGKKIDELLADHPEVVQKADRTATGQPTSAGLSAMLPAYVARQNEANNKLDSFNKAQKEIIRLTNAKEKANKELSIYEKTASLRMAEIEKLANDSKTELEKQHVLTQTLRQQLQDKQNTLSVALSKWQEAEQEKKRLENNYRAELVRCSAHECPGTTDATTVAPSSPTCHHLPGTPDEAEAILKQEKDKADKDVAQGTEAINRLTTKLSQLNGILQTQQRQLENNQANLRAKTEQLTEWMSKHNAEADNQHVELSMLSDLLTANDNWEAIRTDMERKKNAVNAASTLLNNVVKLHTEHLQSAPADNREKLLSAQQELKASSHQKEIITRKARKENHDRALQTLGGRVAELQRIKQEKDDWNELALAFGKDGKTLRKIAQCYTLRFLIEHANAEIRKFNTRYELLQVKNSLAIRVIDHDRADDIRDTTSLSGGETFIVSLGLALGLSALSSRNISFQNLFIDEGFGTLDADTLAVVIDSLAMLQSSQGKKVGVISHTDTMSERITTQIRIVKNGNSGSSHIEIYP